MAAISPSNIYQESCGSLKAHICEFTIGSSPGDTWTSSIPGIMFTCAQGIGSETGANICSKFAASTTIITLGGGVSVTHPAFTCLVLSKS